MNFKVLLTLLVLLSLLQFIAAAGSSSTSGLPGCAFPGERIGVGKGKALSVETESVTLSCKACHSEKCPHWKFDLKRSPQYITRLKQICKDKEVCACSDVALALMSEESTLEEGSAFMQSIQAIYKNPRNLKTNEPEGPEASCDTNSKTGPASNH
jgi:ribosomal protein L24E